VQIIVLLGAVLLIAGCHGKTFDVSDGKSRLVEAEQRAILSVKRTVIGSNGQPVLGEHGRQVSDVSVCAEPSPDALQATAQALGGEASAEVLEAALKTTYQLSETQEYVGLRTQTIQLLRDAYFRLCEAFMNDGIDAIAYDVLQRRFQSQIVALLAVEQLTGAVVTGGEGDNPAVELARIADALDESERTLGDRERKRDEAKDHLAALKDEKPTDEKDKKAHKMAVKAAQKALDDAEERVDRRQSVTDQLKEALALATQRIERRDAIGPTGAAMSAGGMSSTADVTEAVRAITLNAINQDYESQVCFETLRYHNHLGQFRNDINHAFDGGGIPTELSDSTFLHHCKNLFASLADFRNARVSAAEAVADAILLVTKKIGTEELSADEAVTYIRALADAVPTEPGTAFLSHDPMGATVQLPVGGKLRIDGNFEANASIEGNTAADGRDSDQNGETR